MSDTIDTQPLQIELRETFSESEYRALRDAKGDRTWREAILEEFGVGEMTALGELKDAAEQADRARRYDSPLDKPAAFPEHGSTDAIDDAMRTVQEQMDYEVRGAWRAGYDYLHVFEENPLHNISLGKRDLSEEAVTLTQYTYPSNSDEPKRLEHDGIVYSHSYDFAATPDHVMRAMIEQQAGIPSDVGAGDE